jgi:signal transduction histidine kinase
MARKLFWRLYAAIVVVAFVSLAVAGLLAHWLLGHERATPPLLMRCLADLGAQLPPDDPRHLEQQLTRRSERLGVDLSVFDPDGGLLASAGPPMRPPPRHGGRRVRWFRDENREGMAVRLDDGRWLAAAGRPGAAFPGPPRIGVWLGGFALLVGLGSVPVARRITRRLESLRASVDRFGRGELSARAAVEGRDEVADLAGSFNHAAERLQQLIEQQRRVLAHASHELRTPLTRMRMALELLDDGSEARAKLVAAATRDSEELDALIEEVLLSARLDALELHEVGPVEAVDFAGLLATECARIGADLSAAPCTVMGNASLLRRMVRNLLENARRYAGLPVDVRLSRQGASARVEVADRGAGVPAGEEARIFEPFYRASGHREGAHGGVGLGLAMVRQVAMRHGGAAGYSPRPGGGSVFWVEVARASDSPSSPPV